MTDFVRRFIKLDEACDALSAVESGTETSNDCATDFNGTLKSRKADGDNGTLDNAATDRTNILNVLSWDSVFSHNKSPKISSDESGGDCK